jgi:hypothetical protein
VGERVDGERICDRVDRADQQVLVDIEGADLLGRDVRR